jgi:hypothetical protein
MNPRVFILIELVIVIFDHEEVELLRTEAEIVAQGLRGLK